MRIIAGQYKGRYFYMPRGVRPTQNILRKSLFDVLGQDLTGMKFLDLFAGSGAVGIEAISRGAENCIFVEKDPTCAQVIEENMMLFYKAGYPFRGMPFGIINNDAFATVKLLSRRGMKFDVVFADPPYNRELGKKALKTLNAYDIVTPHALVVIEHQKKEILPESLGRFLLFREKTFGKTLLSIYQDSRN